ncbi:MAG TPA: hypothetical protein VN829_23110, partial [Dongiaceae bacterium]|nr:hypothetical protein [Dongiaceae bacterium]
MAAYKFFVDESESPRVAVLAGFSATVDEWDSFTVRWQAILRDAGHVDAHQEVLPFHMTDFESRHPPYDTWSDVKRIKVIKALIDTIN